MTENPETNVPETPVELRPMLDYATVQTWMDGLRQYWAATGERRPDRLPPLEAFCRYANATLTG
jgi:hypothetical protein